LEALSFPDLSPQQRLDVLKGTVTVKEIPKVRIHRIKEVPTRSSIKLSTQGLHHLLKDKALGQVLQRVGNPQVIHRHNQEERDQKMQRRQDLARQEVP
jgi:CRISPR/Cas system-associated endonuclease Cas1